jgi:hypothetical protein
VVDASPDETYPVNIALAGLSSIDQGFDEVWSRTAATEAWTTHAGWSSGWDRWQP